MIIFLRSCLSEEVIEEADALFGIYNLTVMEICNSLPKENCWNITTENLTAGKYRNKNIFTS